MAWSSRKERNLKSKKSSLRSTSDLKRPSTSNNVTKPLSKDYKEIYENPMLSLGKPYKFKIKVHANQDLESARHKLWSKLSLF